MTEPENLHDWWTRTAEEAFRKTIPKVQEYGGGQELPAADLIDIGRSIAAIQGDTEERDDWWYIELGILFYVVGKVARWKAAVAAGQFASGDTLFDIGVYVKMAERNRQVGGWPNGKGAGR